VYGVAIPTVRGVRNVLDAVGSAKGEGRPAAATTRCSRLRASAERRGLGRLAGNVRPASPSSMSASAAGSAFPLP
jgi:hypothetical protein